MTETDAEFVERLRVAASHPYNQHGPHEVLTEAAARIEQLEEEVKKYAMDALLAADGNLMLHEENQRLRAALKLIADGKETEPRILASAMLEGKHD